MVFYIYILAIGEYAHLQLYPMYPHLGTLILCFHLCDIKLLFVLSMCVRRK